MLQWLLSTSHWTTWIPTMVFGIPFFVAYGLRANRPDDHLRRIA